MSIKKVGIVASICFAAVLMSGCSSMSRSVKSFTSDLSGGLEREITVYSATGEELFHQEGKFDVEENEAGSKILYDDENGLRHIVFVGGGTAVVNEVGESASSSN